MALHDSRNSFKTQDNINTHIPANYNIFVPPTHHKSMTQSATASDAPVDSGRLHPGIISFEVVSEI